MIKRTLYIENPAYLKLENDQLVVIMPESDVVKGRVPIEDVALLFIDNSRVTISSPLIERLMHYQVAVVVCNKEHMPNGLMLPLDGHSTMTQHWTQQIAASQPLKKQLWRHTVIAKIANQAAVLQQLGLDAAPLYNYMKQVESGDKSNVEGRAANHYWKQLFPNFKRDRYGDYPNNLLNFGYAILRSVVARAIISSGLLPALGIYHQNKYNSYCLADDLMEPYRPYVDVLVAEWYSKYPHLPDLSRQAKIHLLQLPKVDVSIDSKVRPLLVAVSATTASLQKCYLGERRLIIYPKYEV